jgi:hypothetical protein
MQHLFLKTFPCNILALIKEPVRHYSLPSLDYSPCYSELIEIKLN